MLAWLIALCSLDVAGRTFPKNSGSFWWEDGRGGHGGDTGRRISVHMRVHLWVCRPACWSPLKPAGVQPQRAETRGVCHMGIGEGKVEQLGKCNLLRVSGEAETSRDKGGVSLQRW